MQESQESNVELTKELMDKLIRTASQLGQIGEQGFNNSKLYGIKLGDIFDEPQEFQNQLNQLGTENIIALIKEGIKKISDEELKLKPESIDSAGKVALVAYCGAALASKFDNWAEPERKKITEKVKDALIEVDKKTQIGGLVDLMIDYVDLGIAFVEPLEEFDAFFRFNNLKKEVGLARKEYQQQELSKHNTLQDTNATPNLTIVQRPGTSIITPVAIGIISLLAAIVGYFLSENKDENQR